MTSVIKVCTRSLIASLLFASVALPTYAATYVVPSDDVFVRKAETIVVGHALTSYAEESEKRGIETVTVFRVDEVVKGHIAAGDEIRIRTMGGVVGKRMKIVPGAPKMPDGERVLLFLNRIPVGDYAVTDFGLGLFSFATDDTGQEVVARSATDIFGWDVDGKPHREVVRQSSRFLFYVRGVARNLPVDADYTVETRPTIGELLATSQPAIIRPNAVGTVTAYTLPGGDENANGFRWKTFPVNWNKGNSETGGGVPNGGTDSINTGMGAWNNHASSNINYLLLTTLADPDGINEANDGVNNIVFNKDLTGAGIAAFTCGGGVLGVGGINNSLFDPTNMVAGETFWATTEGDVSMNQGVGPCVGAGLTLGNYNSGLTHELGHTLGFRHSDKTRDNTAACATQPTYDCSPSAIMTATIPNGLNAVLQTWDQSAAAALYPGGVAPPAAPTNVVATATTTVNVQVSWTASGGATGYNVYRSTNGSTFSLAGSSAASPFNDGGRTANTAYLYRVTATGPGGESANSTRDLATTTIFTDPTITANVTKAKVLHITELRTAVNAVRTLASLGAGSYTDTINTTVRIKAVHITDLRTAINAARSALTLTAQSYTDPTITAGTTKVKRLHIVDLRTAVQ